MQIGPHTAAIIDTYAGRSSRSRKANTNNSSTAAGVAVAAAAAVGAVDWPALLALRLQQLAAHAQPLPAMSVAACKVLSQHELAGYWKHYVYKSALMLQQLECAATAAAADAAVVSIQEFITLQAFSSFSVVVLNPAAMIRMAATDFELNTEINPHELDQHWTQVVLGLQLSEQQQQLLMTVFEMIGRDLLAISRQRKRLLAEMILATTAAAKVGGVSGFATLWLR
jgi:hypothetical protein